MLINMALKTWVFTKADQNYYRQPCVANKMIEPNGESITCTPEQEEAQKKIEDENRAAQKQRDASQAVAMLLVATPIWYYHWRMARKEV